MAMATDFSSNHHSSSGTGISGDSLNSHEFRTNLRSPWAQIVRGERESISPVDQSPLSSSSSLSSMAASPIEPPFPDCTATKAAPASPPAENFEPSGNCDVNDDNATAPPRKPAWNKPSNGVVEAGPVMGAVSWPALSESARSSPKLTVDSQVKPANEGSVPTSQVPEIAPPQKQATNNAKSNSGPKHPMPARQKSSKRSGGGSSAGPPRGPGSFISQQSPPPLPCHIYPIFPNSYFNLMPAFPDPSLGEPLLRSNNWDPRHVSGFVPQPNTAADHRYFFPRGNFAFNPRGDGHYHNNHGGRRDQDRGMYPNDRGVHMPQHRPPPRGIMRPSPPYNSQFSQPVRPHGNSMAPTVVYMPSQSMPLEPYRAMPYMPRTATYTPVADHHLSASLVKQIDFYFSDDNLIRDEFLRSHMDDQGWVPVFLIASFPRVKSLTNNLHLIVDSLRASTVVEVQDGRMRRQNGWMRWISIPNRLARTHSAASSSGESGQDKLVSSFQRMRVDGESNSQSTTSDSDPNTEVPSSEFTDHCQVINGEGNNKEV